MMRFSSVGMQLWESVTVRNWLGRGRAGSSAGIRLSGSLELQLNGRLGSGQGLLWLRADPEVGVGAGVEDAAIAGEHVGGG